MYLKVADLSWIYKIRIILYGYLEESMELRGPQTVSKFKIYIGINPSGRTRPWSLLSL
jgi:hypothetical protein